MSGALYLLAIVGPQAAWQGVRLSCPVDSLRLQPKVAAGVSRLLCCFSRSLCGHSQLSKDIERKQQTMGDRFVIHSDGGRGKGGSVSDYDDCVSARIAGAIRSLKLEKLTSSSADK